jgi:hypothetical protein
MSKRLLIGLLVLLLTGGIVAAQQGDEVIPTRGPPGTEIEIVVFRDFPEECYWQTEDNTSTASREATLGTTESAADGSGLWILRTTVPQSAVPGRTYYIYCGPLPGPDDVRILNFVGSFTVIAPPQTGQAVQPEDYFSRVFPTPRGGRVGSVQQIGSQFVVDIEFSNQLSQMIRLRARSTNQQTVLNYARNVRIDFETMPYSPASFQLNPDVSTGQSTNHMAQRADVTVDLTLLSAGTRGQGLANYITYFYVDPPINQGEHHDYVISDQASASARATSDGGQVRLTMWRLVPLDPLYANSDTTRNGETIWLKNALPNGTGNYAARVTGLVGTSYYELSGSFSEMVCPPLDAGCPPEEGPNSALSFARVHFDDLPDEEGLLNVRSGPGTEYGIVTRLINGDPIAIVGQATSSDGATWVRLYSSEPRWINIRFTDYDGDREAIPLSSHWSTGSTSRILSMREEVSGFVGDEYGQAWWFESASNRHTVRVQADAPGTVRVVVSGTHFGTYEFGIGQSEFMLPTNAIGRTLTFIVRFNAGAVGRYSMLVAPQD